MTFCFEMTYFLKLVASENVSFLICCTNIVYFMLLFVICLFADSLSSDSRNKVLDHCRRSGSAWFWLQVLSSVSLCKFCSCNFTLWEFFKVGVAT